MKNPIIYILLLLLVVLSVVFINQNKEEAVGTTLPVAGQTYTLAGGGVSSSATSFTLTSFTIPQTGMAIQDAMISDTFYMTIEPGNRSRQEIVGCTTVTQNGDGTATISGCTRGLSPVTPFTASTTMQFTHSGGSQVVLSNPPQLFEQVGFLDNDEDITGNWTAPSPTASGSIATRGFVLDNVTGGTVTLDGISQGATAGATYGTGTIVYLNSTDGEWYAADADAAATALNVMLGVAQGAGADGTAISGGVLTMGYDETNTSGTPGDTIYLSDTAGATSTSAGTLSMVIGEIEAGGAFYFNPYFQAFGNLSADNTWSGINTFNGTTTLATTTINGVDTSTSTLIMKEFGRITVGGNAQKSATATIPANTLDDDGGLHIYGTVTDWDCNAVSPPGIQAILGGTTVLDLDSATNCAASVENLMGSFDIYIVSSTTASAQEAFGNYNLSDYSDGETFGLAATGTASIDTTSDQNLVIEFDTVTNAEISVTGIIVESFKPY